MERDVTGGLPLRTRGLAALRGVLDSPAARDLLALIELLAAGRPEAVAETCGRLWEELALDPDSLLPDAWQSHLVGRLLDGETPFALGAERGEVSRALAGQASRDLRTLQELFDLEAEVVLRMVESAVPALSGVWVPWRYPGPAEGESPRHAVARKLAAADDWGDCTELLADHYARHGAGSSGFASLAWRHFSIRARVALSRPAVSCSNAWTKALRCCRQDLAMHPSASRRCTMRSHGAMDS